MFTVRWPRRRHIVSAVGVLGTVILVSNEALYWRAARPTLANRREPRGVVVVLGLPGKSAPLRAVQRWRVQMALEARQRCECSTIIFTGGVAKNDSISEARQMALIATAWGLDPDAIVLEDRSRSTKENVRFANELIPNETPLVVVVSDALHASRARQYWLKENRRGLRVELADRYRPFDHLILRVPAQFGELIHRMRNLSQTE